MSKFIRKKKTRITYVSKRKTKLKIFVTGIVECNFLWQVFDMENVQLQGLKFQKQFFLRTWTSNILL